MDLKTQESLNKNPLPNSWIDEIFLRLHGKFGNRFFSNYTIGQLNSNGEDRGVENAKETWARALSGYTGEEIKKGVEHTYSFMPDCDAFKLVCRPSSNYETLFYEAVEQMRKRRTNEDKWTNAGVYHAAVGLGGDLSSLPYQNLKGRWKVALDQARELIENGELENKIPERKEALPAPGKITVSREESERRFAAIHEQLSSKISSNRSFSE